jgi:hypothetical protein
MFEGVLAEYLAHGARAPYAMRALRAFCVIALLGSAGVVAACGSEVAKPAASAIEQSATRSAARAQAGELERGTAAAAARAAREADQHAAAREPHQSPLQRLKAMANEDDGARAAICHRLDVIELEHSDSAEQEYLALKQLVPFAVVADVVDAVSQLAEGDAETLRTFACL